MVFTVQAALHASPGECHIPVEAAVCSDFGDLGFFDSFCITWLMDFQWNWDLFPTNKLLCWDGYSFIPKAANYSLKIRRVMIFQPRVPDKECCHVQDLKQYNCMRAHILQCIRKKADQDGSVALQYVVNSANERYKSHPLFPKGACSDLEGSFFVCSGLCLCCINSRGFNAIGPVNLHSLNPWLSRCHQIRP